MSDNKGVAPKDQSQMGKQNSKQTQVPPAKKGPVATKGGK